MVVNRMLLLNCRDTTNFTRRKDVHKKENQKVQGKVDDEVEIALTEVQLEKCKYPIIRFIN